jgi:hypothetical protein
MVIQDGRQTNQVRIEVQGGGGSPRRGPFLVPGNLPPTHDATHKSVEPQVADEHGAQPWRVAYRSCLDKTLGPIDRPVGCPRRSSPTSSVSIGPTSVAWSGGERNLTLKAVERIADRLALEPLNLLQDDV